MWSLWIPSTEGTKSCSSVTWNTFHKPRSRCNPWSHSRKWFTNRKGLSHQWSLLGPSSALPHSMAQPTSNFSKPDQLFAFSWVHNTLFFLQQTSTVLSHPRVFYSMTPPGGSMVIHAHSHRMRLTILNQAHLAQEDHPNKSIELHWSATEHAWESRNWSYQGSSLKQVSTICWCWASILLTSLLLWKALI